MPEQNGRQISLVKVLTKAAKLYLHQVEPSHDFADILSSASVANHRSLIPTPSLRGPPSPIKEAPLNSFLSAPTSRIVISAFKEDDEDTQSVAFAIEAKTEARLADYDQNNQNQVLPQISDQNSSFVQQLPIFNEKSTAYLALCPSIPKDISEIKEDPRRVASCTPSAESAADHSHMMNLREVSAMPAQKSKEVSSNAPHSALSAPSYFSSPSSFAISEFVTSNLVMSPANLPTTRQFSSQIPLKLLLHLLYQRHRRHSMSAAYAYFLAAKITTSCGSTFFSISAFSLDSKQSVPSASSTASPER